MYEMSQKAIKAYKDAAGFSPQYTFYVIAFLIALVAIVWLVVFVVGTCSDKEKHFAQMLTPIAFALLLIGFTALIIHY